VYNLINNNSLPNIASGLSSSDVKYGSTIVLPPGGQNIDTSKLVSGLIELDEACNKLKEYKEKKNFKLYNVFFMNFISNFAN